MIKLSEIMNNGISDKVSNFESMLTSKYKAVIDELMFYYDLPSNSIFFSDLYIKEKYREQGWGTKIMSEVISFADKNKLAISLIPVSDSNNNKKLVAFYKKLGFVENTNNSRFDDMAMYRLPK